MGDLTSIYYVIPIISLIVIAIGLCLLVMSSHDFFSIISPMLRRLPKNMRKQLNRYTQNKVETNPALAYDVMRIKKDLQSSQIRFRGKPLTGRSLFILSIITGGILSLLCWLVTTKSYLVSSSSTFSLFGENTNPVKTREYAVNLPADIICFVLGFIIPRWYVLFRALKSRYEYQVEASQALHRLASSLRQSQNIEKAITNVIPKLPKYTRTLFIDGKRNWDAKKYSTFSEMLFWLGKESEYSIWEEFANYILLASTMGMRDLVNSTIELAKRAEDLLALKKDEHKGLRFHVVIAVLSFFLLVAVILFLSLKNPDLGMPLYNTPFGKLLISFVYIAIFIEIIAFTWLHYEV